MAQAALPIEPATTPAARPGTELLSRRVALSMLLLFLGIGAVLRGYALGQVDLWLDETSSVKLAQMPWGGFFRALWEYEGNMSFYYVLLSVWLRLGDSEAAIRSLSVVMGVATLAMVYVVGDRLVGRVGAVAATALLSVHSFHITYSRDGRSYSLLLFLLTLSTYLFVRMIETPRRRFVVGYVACGVLAVYAHVFAVLILATHWLSLDGAAWRRIGGRRALSMGVVFATLIAPVAAFVLLRDEGQISWVPKPSARGVYGALMSLSGFNGILLCFAAVGTVLAVSRSVRRLPDAWPLRLFALGVLFPVVVTLAISPLKPIFLARYLTICLPSIALLGGAVIAWTAAASRKGRVAAALAVSVAVALGGYIAVRFMKARARPSEGWKDATEYLLSRRQAADGILFYMTAARDAYDYYRDRVPARALDVPMPVVLLPDDSELATFRPRPPAERVHAAATQRPRLWLVFYRARAENEPAIRAALEPEFALVDEKWFGNKNPMVGIRVAQYVARRPPDHTDLPH